MIKQHLKIGLLFLLLVSISAQLACVQRSTAKGENLQFKSSWFGNTGGNKNTAGQSWIERIKVRPDGSVLSQTGWDEGGNNNVIYKNGTRVGRFRGTIDPYQVTIRNKRWIIPNPKFLGGDRVQTADGKCVIRDAGTPSALAVSNKGHLMVADNGPRQYVRIYDVSSCKPKLVRTFGEEGGVFSKGKPAGVVEPLRFYGLNGVGMDRIGNICVGGQIVGGGGWIRCLTPQGKLKWQVYSAGWLSNAAADPDTDGSMFYSSSAAYRMNYATTKQGKEAGDFPVRFTIDIFRYPDDPRAKVYADGKSVPLKEAPAADAHYAVNPKGIVAVRSCGTKRKYLFGSGQNGPKLGAYKTDERGIFVPMKLKNIEKAWAMNVDDRCNIWVGTEGENDKGVLMYPFLGADARGNLQYGQAKIFPRPFADMTTVQRIHYDTKQDALYLTGYSQKYPHKDGWGLVGSVMYRWNGISQGKMELHPGYPMVFPDEPHGTGSDSGAAPGRKTSIDIETSPRYKSIAWAGKYAFATYVARNKTEGGRRGYTDVYDLDTGKKVGSLFPDRNIMRHDDEVGWVDIVNGNSAFLRSNGEYVVSVEDDAYNKYLLYRWCPTDKC